MNDLYKRWQRDTSTGRFATDEQAELARSIFEVIEASRCTDQSKNPPTSVFLSQTIDAVVVVTNGSPATPVLQTRVSVSLEALVSRLEKSGFLSLDFGNGVKLSITRGALGVCHFNLELGGKSQN